jgi:hypothetical protein
VGKSGKAERRYKDLDIALQNDVENSDDEEWRIHFHVPLHASPHGTLGDTQKQVLDTLDWLALNPNACRHLEMETYTWEVLPKELQSTSVVKQVAKEYEWTLKALKERALCQ